MFYYHRFSEQYRIFIQRYLHLTRLSLSQCSFDNIIVVKGCAQQLKISLLLLLSSFILQTMTKNNTQRKHSQLDHLNACCSRVSLSAFSFPPLRAHFSFNYSENMEQLFIFTNACICGIIRTLYNIMGGSKNSFNFFCFNAVGSIH